ncbi:MAG: hypothetical protein KJ072_22480 [Verrucomicrobia bacterium]|nr:hypothetical protein [Verrucomicrobiota bacterium]
MIEGGGGLECLLPNPGIKKQDLSNVFRVVAVAFDRGNWLPTLKVELSDAISSWASP